MKLANRTELERDKEQERRLELNEGLKLARKVDEVRIELVKEQNNLQKFKEETTTRVQAEIDNLIKHNAELKRVNEILSRSNKTLYEPFDKEWEELNWQRKEELDRNCLIIERDKIVIEQDRTQIAILRRQAEEQSGIIETKLKEAEDARIKARVAKEKAEKSFTEAEIHQAEVISQLDAERNQINKKAEEVALQVRDMEIREASMKRTIEALAKREIFVNDKYRQLQRTVEALKAKGIKI